MNVGVAVVALCWSLWLERNNRIFDKIEAIVA